MLNQGHTTQILLENATLLLLPELFFDPVSAADSCLADLTSGEEQSKTLSVNCYFHSSEKSFNFSLITLMALDSSTSPAPSHSPTAGIIAHASRLGFYMGAGDPQHFTVT